MLKGKAVSPGVALAPAYVYLPDLPSPSGGHIPPERVEQEIAILNEGIRIADEELVRLIDSFPDSEAEQAKIFAAHREILNDEALLDMIPGTIREELVSAETAAFLAFDSFIALLGGAEDANIAMRTADLTDVRNRLVRCLRGGTAEGLAHLPGDCILVARDLLPSETVSMDRKRVLGIVTETGGATSHTAILARSYGIPALLGVSDATRLIKTGDALVLDALDGTLSVRPDEKAIADGETKRAQWFSQRAGEETARRIEARTKDGIRIEIGLNIGSDAEPIPEYVDFVGLFRTEFLYMDSGHLPTEEEQFAAYRRVLEHANGRPVTLRTLDIGADKALPYLRMEKEENPALGNRALRFCLNEVHIFKTQLRAALRAAAYGNLWLMFPMVGGIDDVERAKAVIDEAEAELAAENPGFRASYRTGIMIEIPSIALIADLAAQAVDFASIGTNDLCQYTHAADRMNAAAAPYYQNKSTAMYRLIGMAISGFLRAGKPISVCGELGGDPEAAAVMVGMGIRKLSMSDACVARVKKRLSELTLDEAEKLAREAVL